MSDDPLPVRSPLLDVSGLRKAFGATVALAGLDLAVARDEVLALMEANGAGKSTLVSILGGAALADDGAVLLDGRPFAPTTPAEARRARIAVVHQAAERAGVPGLAEADALALDQLADGRSPVFVTRARIRREAARLAARAGFALPLDADFADLKPADRQLVGTARAVSADARLVVLDEPRRRQRAVRRARRLRGAARAGPRPALVQCPHQHLAQPVHLRGPHRRRTRRQRHRAAAELAPGTVR